MSLDPITTDAHTGRSFNRYNYANNSPYKYVDPDGRMVAVAAPLIVEAVKQVAIQVARIGASVATAALAAKGAAGLSNSSSEEGSTAAPPTAAPGVQASGTNTPTPNSSDAAVGGLTAGLQNETDAKGRPVKGQYVNAGGSAQDALDSLPGESGKNGQKTMPDGSTAGVHTSTTTGAAALHVHRPTGKQDIKIRFPKP